MQAERDHLRDIIFPELDQRLRSLKGILIPIDLRWGVETSAYITKEEKELQIIKVCLDEIERSKPFMIIILGEEYGWVPPEQSVTEILKSKKTNLQYGNKSITDIEIQYGMSLENKHLLFYFRNKQDGQNKVQVDDRLQSLKNQISSQMPRQVKHYTIHSDIEQKKADIKAWGKIVLEDLWQALKENYQQTTEIKSWQEEEISIINELTAIKAAVFKGREDIYKEIQDFLSSKVLNQLIIHAESGLGKSALIAYIHKQLNKEKHLLLINISGSTLYGGSVMRMLMRWCEELSQYNGVEKSYQEESLDILIATFSELLEETSKKTPIIILIDALDRFERTTAARHLQWLPEELPQNTYFIATTIFGTECEALLRRKNSKLIPLPPLNQTEGITIIQGICKKYHKELNQKTTELLVTKHTKELQGAENPLWLSIAAEHLLLLDEEDFIYSKTLTGTDEENLQTLIIEKVQSFSEDINELYISLFRYGYQKFLKLYKIEWTPHFLSFLALSRRGLRENDLINLLKQKDKTEFSIALALLKRYFRAHIYTRATDQHLDFSHNQARLAMKRTVILPDKIKYAYYKQLADYIETLPSNDSFRIQERMYFLIHSNQTYKALMLIIQEYDKPDIEFACETICQLIIEESENKENKYINWLAELLICAKSINLTIDEFEALNRAILGEIATRLIDNTPHELRLAIFSKIKEYLGHFENSFPIEVTENLLNIYYACGRMYYQMNNHTRALQEFEAYKNLHQSTNPTQIDQQFHRIANAIYEEEGDIFIDIGRTEEALKSYWLAHDKYIEILQADTINTQTNVLFSLTSVLERIASLYRQLGNQELRIKYATEAFQFADVCFKGSQTFESSEAVIISSMALGDAFFDNKKLEAALEKYQILESHAIMLNSLRPDSIKHLDLLALSYERLDQFRKDEEGKKHFNENYLTRIYNIRIEICKKVPDSVDYAQRLAIVNKQLAGDKAGQQDELSHYQKARKSQIEHFNANPKSFEIAHRLSMTHLDIADYHLRWQNYQQAHQAAEDCIKLIHPFAQLTPPLIKCIQALAEAYELQSRIFLQSDEIDKSIENALLAKMEFERYLSYEPKSLPIIEGIIKTYRIICSELNPTTNEEMLVYLREFQDILQTAIEIKGNDIAFTAEYIFNIQGINALVELEYDIDTAADGYAQIANCLKEAEKAFNDKSLYLEWCARVYQQNGFLYMDRPDRVEQAIPIFEYTLQLLDKVIEQSPEREQQVLYRQVGILSELSILYREAKDYKKLEHCYLEQHESLDLLLSANPEHDHYLKDQGITLLKLREFYFHIKKEIAWKDYETKFINLIQNAIKDQRKIYPKHLELYQGIIAQRS